MVAARSEEGGVVSSVRISNSFHHQHHSCTECLRIKAIVSRVKQISVTKTGNWKGTYQSRNIITSICTLQDPMLFNTYVVGFFIAPKPNPIRQVYGNEKLHHPKIELAGREEHGEMRNRVWAAVVRSKRIKNKTKIKCATRKNFDGLHSFPLGEQHYIWCLISFKLPDISTRTATV